MAAVIPTEVQKRALARDVGGHLVKTYGKRAHYAPAIVAASVRRLGRPPAWECWAASLFCTHAAFAQQHATRADPHDYVRMRAQMFDALNGRPLSESEGTDWNVLGDLFNIMD